MRSPADPRPPEPIPPPACSAACPACGSRCPFHGAWVRGCARCAWHLGIGSPPAGLTDAPIAPEDTHA